MRLQVTLPSVLVAVFALFLTKNAAASPYSYRERLLEQRQAGVSPPQSTAAAQAAPPAQVQDLLSNYNNTVAIGLQEYPDPVTKERLQQSYSQYNKQIVDWKKQNSQVTVI